MQAKQVLYVKMRTKQYNMAFLAGAKESKLRYIGKLLVKMANDGQIKKDKSGKHWVVTLKGENDLVS